MSSELLKLNILMKAEHPAFMLRQALSLKAVAQVVAEAAVNNAFKIPILSIGIFLLHRIYPLLGPEVNIDYFSSIEF